MGGEIGCMNCGETAHFKSAEQSTKRTGDLLKLILYLENFWCNSKKYLRLSAMVNLKIRLAVFAAFLSLATTLPAANDLPEIVSQIPIEKLAFVTGTSFGSPGTISVLGQSASPFLGGTPSFSADGKTIFYSDKTDSGSGIFARNIAENSSRRIENRAHDSDSPSLSPDGSKLLFVVWPVGRESSHIYLSDANGANWTPLTTGNCFNWSPKWSPDGTKILFESTRDGQRQIYVMDADGREQTNLTHDDALNHAPSWSPDGEWIAFMSRAEKNANIFVMKRDGTQKRNVSKGKTRDSEPVWSPDGQWIAFTRTANNPPKPETMDIWIMKRDGTEQRQITRNKEPMGSYAPAWSR